MFARSLEADGLLPRVSSVRAELFGSLGATGHGHGSVKAVVLGLAGQKPETVDPAAAEPLVDETRRTGTLALLGSRPIAFDVRPGSSRRCCTATPGSCRGRTTPA